MNQIAGSLPGWRPSATSNGGPPVSALPTCPRSSLVSRSLTRCAICYLRMMIIIITCSSTSLPPEVKTRQPCPGWSWEEDLAGRSDVFFLETPTHFTVRLRQTGGDRGEPPRERLVSRGHARPDLPRHLVPSSGPRSRPRVRISETFFEQTK